MRGETTHLLSTAALHVAGKAQLATRGVFEVAHERRHLLELTAEQAEAHHPRLTRPLEGALRLATRVAVQPYARHEQRRSQLLHSTPSSSSSLRRAERGAASGWGA